MDKQSRKVIGMVLTYSLLLLFLLLHYMRSATTFAVTSHQALNSPQRYWWCWSVLSSSLCHQSVSQSITLCIDSWLDLAFNESPY